MPVHPPKQRRSQETFDRVLETSTRLLEEAGFEAFTVQEVSRRSRVSVGAIYARFGSKEPAPPSHSPARNGVDALRARHGRACRRRARRPAREVITLAVRMVSDIFRGNEKLLSAFMHLGAVDDEIARRGSGMSIDLGRQFATTVLHHRDEITHPDPDRAADIAFRMAYCTFARQVMYGPHSRATGRSGGTTWSTRWAMPV